MKKQELKQKLLQMLILGYEGERPSENILRLVSQGLGGIIFFAENLKVRSVFKEQIKYLKKIAQTPLFLSIDQEGGLVERTIFLDKKNEYITPKALSRLNNKTDLKTHYELLAMDLRDLGLNFNFAPVLDVNTNPYNPVINVRSFGYCAGIVSEYGSYVIDAFRDNHIITCAKHFAGHGDTSIDSHLNMPQVDMEYEKFYTDHLVCFNDAIKKGVQTIMVSHVHFPFFNEFKMPSSLSGNAIEIYLKNILNFKGLIISDDMVMGGITQNYGLKESLVLAITAGIDVLIFRNITQELLDSIDEVAFLATNNLELQSKIIQAHEKIIKFKKENIKEIQPPKINIEENQKTINAIAQKTILVEKGKEFLPLSKQKEITILSFNFQEIFNLSANKYSLGDFMQGYKVNEVYYPLNPTEGDIQKIKEKINNSDITIFLSYNAHINKGQISLFNSINTAKILVSCALDYDIKLFANADCIISLCCAKTPSIKALAELLIQN